MQCLHTYHTVEGKYCLMIIVFCVYDFRLFLVVIKEIITAGLVRVLSYAGRCVLLMRLEFVLLRSIARSTNTYVSMNVHRHLVV